MTIEPDRVTLKGDNLFKSFGHIEALRGVTFLARAGEIAALVGDNGAGKSTLIKLFSGALRPDGGTITVRGDVFPYLTPGRALDLGISTVYQDLALGDSRNTSENIFLGGEHVKGGFLQKKRMRREARELIDRLGIRIPDITTPVGFLSGGQRQGVAVARLIQQGGTILIFDEPTAAMGPVESDHVLRLMRTLADEGYTIIMISHNLPQVFEVSDRIWVLRRGEMVEQLETKETDMKTVVTLIAGGERSEVAHENACV